MATAIRISQIRGYSPSELRGTALGWVGSKAGKRGDFVQVDSNGYIDQAAAAGAAVSTVKVAVLNNKIASTVAAAATAALAAKMQILHDDDIVELQIVNNSDTALTVSSAYEGDAFGIYRLSTGDYAADANGNTHLLCVGINADRNTGLFKLIETYRMK